jgi:hypothetical protein
MGWKGWCFWYGLLGLQPLAERAARLARLAPEVDHGDVAGGQRRGDVDRRAGRVELDDPREACVRSLHERSLSRPRATNRARLSSVAALEAVLEQALQLTDDERGELIAHLLRSLEPDDGEEVIGDEWEAAWSTELDDRVREIRDGSIELIDGDEAIAKVRAAINARRP